MLITVIIPVYNVADYIGACILSVMNQTYKNIEILVINDGSKDASISLVKEISLNDQRIKILDKPNGGLSDARNFGILHATGDYLMFVDGDDEIALETIEFLVEKQRITSAEIVVCDMLYEYGNHNHIASGGNFEVESFKNNHNIIFINNSACNKLFAKELFNDIKFPIGMWYEDLAVIPILISKANKIAKVNKALYIYNQRSGSIAHSVSEKIFDIYKAINMIDIYFRDHNVKAEINHLYIHHGLFLTTLRIKESSNQPICYWKKNNQMLDEYFPKWRKINWFKGYSLKENIIFKCLQKNQFTLVARMYKVVT